MNTFANPEYLWLLLVLPFLWFIKRQQRRTSAIQFPSLEWVKKSAPKWSHESALLTFLRYSALIFIILALARPQKMTQTRESTSSGIDIMIAVDSSSSMMCLDFAKDNALTTRLDVAKQLTEEFIQGRPGDRIGLCTFAGNPYLVSPVTLNHEWLIANLQRLHVHLIEDGTAIGNTIAMCANRLKKSEAKSKIIVLLTDGTNNAGKVTPEIAAEAAAALGIKIYTIAIGKEGTVSLAYPDENGNILCDALGRPVIVQVPQTTDNVLLQLIAEKTKGQFFKAENKEQFSKIFDTIDMLEKSEIKEHCYTDIREFFWYLLIAALLLLLLEYLLRNTRLQRIP